RQVCGLSMDLPRIGRALLFFVFGTSAALKVFHFLLRDNWQAVAPVLRNHSLMGAIVAIELTVAAGLLMSRWRLSCWGVLLFATSGTFVQSYVRSVYGETSSCGCVGPTVLSPLQHVALAAVLFVLASRCLLDGARTSVAQSH
ncbi:MAG: MauE/DoxX family redox-associated membrane protein, partial [Planctomycetota bacterium]